MRGCHWCNQVQVHIIHIINMDPHITTWAILQHNKWQQTRFIIVSFKFEYHSWHLKRRRGDRKRSLKIFINKLPSFVVIEQWFSSSSNKTREKDSKDQKHDCSCDKSFWYRHLKHCVFNQIDKSVTWGCILGEKKLCTEFSLKMAYRFVAPFCGLATRNALTPTVSD